MRGIVKRIACSHCGAPLEPEPGEVLITCRYCGFTNAVDTAAPFVLEHSMYVNRYDKLGVEEILRAWMRSGFVMPQDLARKAKIQEMELIFVPLWIVTVEATTTYQGIFERIGPGTVRMGKLARNYDWIVEAQRDTGFPAREYKLPMEGMIPFTLAKIPSGAKVLNSEVDSEEAVARAKQQIEEHHKFLISKDVDRIVEIQTDLEVVRVSYLHVPIWRVTYEYRGKRYSATVDGATGAILRSDIPT
jgi:hypothetical protein